MRQDVVAAGENLYVYSPDGKQEGWYMSNEVPPGWGPNPPGDEIHVDPKGTDYPVEEDTGPQDSEPEPHLRDAEAKGD